MLTDLSGQSLVYDPDGNLISDGTRNYAWDAENRLVQITYPGQPGKETAFAYDGLGRRVAIASTPSGGGGAATTSYLWCGSRLCQARNTANATTREYFSEGEYVPGAPATPLYYGPDQLGTVRRVFASAANAPAYSYDPCSGIVAVNARATRRRYLDRRHGLNRYRQCSRASAPVPDGRAAGSAAGAAICRSGAC